MKLYFISVCLLASMLWGSTVYAQSTLFERADYANGLRAYLDEDYQTAQLHWLNSAKDNDAKSMFNLGLLHERKLITGSDEQKADKWFRLAGEHGYAVADYHLAQKLLANGDKAEANSLLNRAASSGFLLAAQQLGQTIESDRDELSINKSELKAVNQTTLKAVNQTELKAVNTNAHVKYLDETWILQRKPSAWTIQMLAFKELEKVQKFIQENDLNNQAAYFVERSNDGVYYKLIYGVYDTKEQANQARNSLTTNLKKFGPWLRPIASVQAAIAKP